MPASFRSLYRLVLRASSASVLHHRGATKTIRQLYRSNFDEAAAVSRELQLPALELKKRQELELWCHNWNKTMDRTLDLLLHSATIRGTPSKVTKNLARLLRIHTIRREKAEAKARPEWLPNLDPEFYDKVADDRFMKADRGKYGSKAYAAVKRIQAERSTTPEPAEKADPAPEIERQMDDMFAKVVVMAEATAGISLGRLK